MPDSSANLEMPYLLPAQAQKHVTHNEALRRLDVAVQLCLSGVGATVPPALPRAGEVHALGAGATGAWAGRDGTLAFWDGVAWDFIAPRTGWRGWDIAGARLMGWDGAAWVPVVPVLDNLPGLGIATAADAVNRLAVASDAVLLSHAGGGHQLKINKAAATDTASLLFQSAWTGHAEMGLAGSTDWSIKVSSDGATWTEALRIDAATGLVGGAAVQAGPDDVTPGRLMRADYGYGRGNLLGTVGEAGGQPTGAAMERGSNANGQYLRLADGTQICWTDTAEGRAAESASGGVWRSSTDGAWTFPALFVNGSVIVMATADSPARWATARVAAPTGAVFSHFQGTKSTTNVNTRLIAIGRWF